MKVAVLIFHKNIDRYPPHWISVFVESIQNQTYKDFDVFELNYGGDARQIYPGSIFSSLKLDNHAQALNSLVTFVKEEGYEAIFNTNVDDFYSAERIEKQLPYIEQGFDVISSNFHLVDENGNIYKSMEVDGYDIEQKAFNEKDNIIAHPVVCFSNRFNDFLDPAEIPRDDFELWKRCYHSRKYKFKICKEYLLYYRVHNQKTS